MSQTSENLMLAALRQPITALAYFVSETLAAASPHRVLMEGDACSFDLKQFVDAGHCAIRPQNPDILNQISVGWNGPEEGIDRSYRNVYFEVEWERETLDVVLMSWPEGHMHESRFWIIADTEEIAERFFVAVCAWAAEVRGEVLVYESGGWAKSKELFAAIQSARLDNLILQGSLKQEIGDDLTRFFASREQYERYGVPWKRGVLFLGPPGNGKTHCIKALINELKRPCLYVKSFKSQYDTDQDNIRSVFARARKTTPCVLVLEDLDSLIDDANRAFFLNELDGFASNVGIVTLATTNHPERLDPSIVDRPSRFDRKYHFELPAPPERGAYIALWNAGLQYDLRLTDTGMETVVALTEEFSFAYLKELFVSSVMAWINAPQTPNNMDDLMQTQIAALRDQMNTMAPEYVGDSSADADPMAAAFKNAAQMMRRYRR